MKMNSPQKTARVAACVFLGIFFLGMSTELFIRPGMIVPRDAVATVRNIAASEALFWLSLVSDLLRQVLLMLLPLGQYHRQPHHDRLCCRRRSLLSTLHLRCYG